MNYLGNGRIFALVDGQNIQYLCPYGMPSFLQISCTEALIATTSRTVCHAKTPETAAYDGKITQIDALFQGCLVRYIETTKPLEISLISPGYCRLYPYPDLKYHDKTMSAFLLRLPMGIPTGCGCTTSEERLLVTVVGNAAFAEDGKTVHVHPGRSAILFVYAHPKQLREDAVYFLDMLDAPHFTQSTLYQKASAHHVHGYRSAASDTLLALFAETGGVLGGHGEHCVYTADLPMVGQALLKAKYKEQAVQVAKFLLKLYRQYGYLPLFAHPTAGFPACEKTETESAVYPSVGLFFHALIEQGVESKCKQELEKTISQMIDHSCRHAVAGELGFCPLSFSMRRGDIPPEKQTEANALATAELLYLLTLYPSSRGNSLRQTALMHLKKDFPAEKMTICDRHRLARCRLPAALYGSCPACGDFAYVGWLTRAKFGSYLCPACYGKGMREWTLAKQDAVLPGSYATYLHHLYKASVMDYHEFCQALVRCAEAAKAETISFYELCLLLPVLYEVGSPDYKVLLSQAETMLAHRTRQPLFAAEAAAYLLAKTL